MKLVREYKLYVRLCRMLNRSPLPPAKWKEIHFQTDEARAHTGERSEGVRSNRVVGLSDSEANNEVGLEGNTAVGPRVASACPACGGAGNWPKTSIPSDCSACGGTGKRAARPNIAVSGGGSAPYTGRAGSQEDRV